LVKGVVFFTRIIHSIGSILFAEERDAVLSFSNDKITQSLYGTPSWDKPSHLFFTIKETTLSSTVLHVLELK
jgi:hypothetical protein